VQDGAMDELEMEKLGILFFLEGYVVFLLMYACLIVTMIFSFSFLFNVVLFLDCDCDC